MGDWYGDRLAERGVELWHESGDKVDESRYHHFPSGHSPRWRTSDDGTGKPLDGTRILHDYVMFDRTALRREQTPGPEVCKSGDSGFFWMGSQPWLKVNGDGRRFINESGTYENILHADEYQKGHVHYVIFDSNWTKYVAQFKMHGCSRLVPFENDADPNIPYQTIRDKMLPDLIAKKFVIKADTLEELARGLGLPEKTFKETVARYNKLVAAGEDTDYGKKKFRLSPVNQSPYYSAKTTGQILCTMDGIQIDTHMNAIDTEGNPIPGLYVIGNDSSSYFANEYPNLSTGMACGRLVGQYLAKL